MMDDVAGSERDYDVDDRWAHIRVEVLGREYTDVVRVCEQFPDLPEGITVYVEHVDAIDLRRETKRAPPFYCFNCGDQLATDADHGWVCLTCRELRARSLHTGSDHDA